MNEVDKKLGIVFDDNNNTVMSREKLFQILRRLGICTVMTEMNALPAHGYMLIDNKSKEVYLFSEEDLQIWENDGSFEPGDSLYKIEFIMKKGSAE